MPRIRTIKPEFCTSEQVADCSTNARLLFVLMWCFCDDAGRHPANSKRLKMECFPGDTFATSEIDGMVDELIRVGLLFRYEHEGVAFWQVTGWKKHQRIDKASYKYGPLDEDGSPIEVDISTSIPRAVDERSKTPHPRKGMEGNGKDRKGVESSCGVGDKSPTPPDPSEYSFVICDGSEWFLSLSKIDEYRKTFPELDLGREFRKAAQWLRDRPKKRKTKTGMHAFLGSWLATAQNRGDSGSSDRPVQKTFADLRLEGTQKAMEEFVNER